MVEWKTASIQIVLPLLTSGLAISAFSSFYNDTYNKPNIQVEITTNEIDGRISVVEINNIGRVPATGVTITIDTPEIISDYEIFNTENVTIINSTKDELILELYMPRLVNGEGSFIGIVIISSNRITDYNDYNVYVTYDQGSVKVGAVKRELNLRQQLFETFSGSGSLFIGITSVIATIAVSLIPYYIKRRRGGRISLLTKYAKVIDSIYETLGSNRDECLGRLNDIQKEITHLFMRGKINATKYTILSNKISFYLSRL